MKTNTMKILLCKAIISLCSAAIFSQSSQKIHDKAIFVDTHNDFLTQTMERGFVFDTDLKGKTHSDLNRLKEGVVDVQFFSVWSDGDQPNPYVFANRQINSLDGAIKRNPDKILKVTSYNELQKTLVGVDYVGIGSDFDGIVLPPKQMDDVTNYPLITKALVEKCYSEIDIDKLLGGNILRVLKANETKSK